MDMTLKVLGTEDHALLSNVPAGLFDNPIDPVEATRFLTDPLHHIVLAFVDELAVGMGSGTVLYHPDKKPSFFINEVGTRDGWTRQGIATAVCNRLFTLARSLGCEGIWLGTEADNDAAIGLYRALEGVELRGVYFGWDDAL